MPDQSNNPDAKPKYRPKATRLMDQVREVLRYHHYGYQNEQVYTRWIRNSIKYNGTRHPREMRESEMEACLSHLAMLVMERVKRKFTNLTALGLSVIISERYYLF